MTKYQFSNQLISVQSLLCLVPGLGEEGFDWPETADEGQEYHWTDEDRVVVAAVVGQGAEAVAVD